MVIGINKQQLRKLWEQAIAGEEQSDLPDLAATLIPRLPEWAQPLMQAYRYKCLFGGRGAGKSISIADALLITGLQRKIRVLCAREFQNSIKESVHALLKERIEALGLSEFYSAGEQVITGQNGSQFIFKGVKRNVASIQSMTGITHLWIEEAQTISAESWRVLVPTIRAEGSEIWVSFNPKREKDTIWKEMVATKRSNAYVRRVNWNENPYFPEVLNQERLQLLETDPDLYFHVWEGGFWEESDLQIFHGKWIVKEFEPGEDWNGPYHGADWGFGTSPTTAVRVWIYDRCLWVERESYKHQLELDDTARLWLEDIPDIDKYTVRADSARPESISHVRRGRGESANDKACPPIPLLVPAKKGPGSIEDGIEHIRSYRKIIIHSRCHHVIEEAKLYSFKRDKLTGDPTNVIVDAYNDCWDAIRYALEPLIKVRRKAPPPATFVNW